jgi:acetylornithine deacetylase/succinyl-diaminopimelate desuccinylase-like protein
MIPTRRPLAAAALLVALPVLPLRAQANDPALKGALDRLKADNAWTLDQQQSICQIPAPPFKEAARAAEMKRRFEALGYKHVTIDAEGNVIAERPGSGNGPVLVLAAHLDTVFPEGTDVTVKRDGTTMKAPGIGDDCRGLAVILSIARAMELNKVRTRGTVLFVANVGEEGPGDLRGVRYLFNKSPLKERITHFISVDGTGLSLVHRGVGSHRYKVRFTGPGGHSFGAFGMPNPAHALGRAIAKISELRVPLQPKTTFNVGVLSGGTSVNSIPFEVAMEVDMRSESAAELDKVDAAIRAAIAAAVEEEKGRWPASKMALEAHIDTIGIRAASETATEQTPIVKAALDAAVALGAARPTPRSGSTDSNVPLGLGLPAITMGGGGLGTDAHSLREAYNDGTEGWKGPQWVLSVVAALVGLDGVRP